MRFRVYVTFFSIQTLGTYLYVVFLLTALNITCLIVMIKQPINQT